MEGATVATGKWQYKCERAAVVLESGAWSDCSFIVGTEKEVFKGHKQILALASPVFETMFFGNMPETNGPVLIDDVDPDTFKTLLTFIYTDIIEISSVDEACDLCYVANKYMLQDLVMECSKYLEEHLEAVTACRIYETANLFDMEILRDKCIEIISTNTSEVLNEPSFDNVDLKTLVTVFSLDTLNIESEVELIEAAARYAKAQEVKTGGASGTVESSAECSWHCSRHCPSRPQEESDDVDFDSNLQFRSAIEQIRFLTVTPQQFSASSARSLLPMDEVGAVLMNIASSDCGVPMPKGLSTCREPRKRVTKAGETGASGQQADGTMILCQRAQGMQVVQIIMDCTETQPLMSVVAFTVDEDIWLLGVQVPTPAAPDDDNCYKVSLRRRQLMMFNLILEETCLPVTRHGGVDDLTFKEPILIEKNQVYRVIVRFPQGRYGMVKCLMTVKSESVLFNFEEYQNDGLIRSLIWRT